MKGLMRLSYFAAGYLLGVAAFAQGNGSYGLVAISAALCAALVVLGYKAEKL